MSLTTNQIRTFRTEGYLISPHFFNPKDVRALQLEVERFQREGLGRNVVPVINGDKSRINYQIMPLHDKSTLFRALWFHPSVLEIVEQLIGGPVMRWLDQIFLKPPKLGKGTEWHQDNAYFKVPDSTKGVAMWIAIHDATRENGTLEVIPRSFQFTDLVYRKSSNSDHHITCDLNAQIESQAVAAEMAAGGVVFFNYGVLHCTRENRSSKARAGAGLHFLNVDNFPTDEGAVIKEKGTILTGPESTDGEKEYGVRVAGSWEKEVEKLLNSKVL